MPKLLLAEDNELNRDMLSRRLQRRGYEVVIAPDGAAAILLAKRESPDLILMDLSLPVVDGWEATRQLKADPATRGIPILVLTAHAMSGEEARARSAGCDDFDTKPVDLTRLLGKITRWLGPVPIAVPETGSVQALKLPAPAQLSVTATRDALGAVLAFVDQTSARFGLEADLASRVRLAVEEIAINVMDYGYAGRAPGPLKVRLVRTPDALKITLEDEAAPFDPASIATPALDVDCDDRSVGGLGWHLVRKVMDQVSHESLAGGGNRVTLIARLTPSPR